MPDLFDPLDQDWLQNKHTYYRHLRDHRPVYWSPKYNMYVLTRYEDVRVALRDSETYSSARGNLIVESPHRFGRTLGASDNPIHDELKALVQSAYSKDRLRQVLNGSHVAVKEDMADATEQASALFTARLLALPVSEALVGDMIVQIQRHASQSVVQDVNDEAYAQYQALLAQAGPAVSDGVYKCFVDGGRRYRSLMTGPTLSGTSSTTGALQFLLLDLAANPEQYQAIRSDKTLIPAAVRESIRLSSSTGRFSRTLTADVLAHGITMPVGSRVALCLDAANRDHRAFNNPDQFDLTRSASSLGFGYGMHACIALFLTTAFLEDYLSKFVDQVASFEVENHNPRRRLMSAGNFDVLSDLRIRWR